MKRFGALAGPPGMKELAEPVSLSERHCKPCTGDEPPLKGRDIKRLAGQVPEWDVVEDHHLQRTFSFPDFASALIFANRIGEAAEREGHHPVLEVSWGRLGVRLTTHAAGGLTENDFILAARINGLPQ
jgi:4a-hydroxytetrahydrobiopterin dehydratase